MCCFPPYSGTESAVVTLILYIPVYLALYIQLTLSHTVYTLHTMAKGRNRQQSLPPCHHCSSTLHVPCIRTFVHTISSYIQTHIAYSRHTLVVSVCDVFDDHDDGRVEIDVSPCFIIAEEGTTVDTPMHYTHTGIRVPLAHTRPICLASPTTGKLLGWGRGR